MTEIARLPVSRRTPARPGAGAEVRPISSAKRRRISKTALRSIAWIGGGAAFLAAWMVIDIAPRPDASQATTTTPVAQRPVVLVHHIIRKVIIQDQAPSGGGGGYTSSGSSGGVIYIPAAAAAPVVSSGGSHT